MRMSLGVRFGPLYIGSGNLLRKRPRKPAKPRHPYWTHTGCSSHHVSIATLQRCAAKKHLLPGDPVPHHF